MLPRDGLGSSAWVPLVGADAGTKGRASLPGREPAPTAAEAGPRDPRPRAFAATSPRCGEGQPGPGGCTARPRPRPRPRGMHCPAPGVTKLLLPKVSPCPHILTPPSQQCQHSWATARRNPVEPVRCVPCSRSPRAPYQPHITHTPNHLMPHLPHGRCSPTPTCPSWPLLPLPALLWPYAKTPMSHLKPGELLCCSGPSAPGRLSSLYCTSHLQGLVGAAVRVRSQRGQGKGGSEQVMNHRGVAARSSLCPQCSSPHSLMQHHGCPASIW